MNYVKEINMFYVWTETNEIPSSCINLWHALMNINNRTGWKKEFTVAISTLEVKTGLKKAAIIRARAKLQELGRLDFKSRNGQKSAVYKIIPLENQFEYLKETQSGTQSVTINKLNNTKLNNILSSSKEDPNHNTLLCENAAVKFFEQNIHMPKSYECEVIIEWLGKYSDELIIEAIKIAVENGASSIKYIDTILLDWEKAGVMTPAAVQAYIESWRAKKQGKGNVTKFPNAAQRFTNIATHEEWDFDELERLEREYVMKKLAEGRGQG